MPYAEPAATKTSEWAKRVARATLLRERFAYAREVLGFYGEVLKLQQKIYEEISSKPLAEGSDQPCIDQLRSVDVSRHLPMVLALAEQRGPARLAERARTIRGASAEQQAATMAGFFDGGDVDYEFFGRSILQPCAERIASSSTPQVFQGDSFACRLCGSRPQAAVLRPEGDGGKRFLLCSLCLTEWEFRRVLCPVCGEENHRQLPRYQAEEVDAVRVEACDTCHFYLKSIDLTVDGRAVPLVDEVASVPLDLWASEHGYKKIVPNVMGF